MHALHLSAVDLNQLPVLDALLEEKSVTAAARRLGLSQSATSHALARLRATFDDALLIRGPDGMVLTARAEGLRRPLREALHGLGLAIAEPETFAPETTSRSFSVATADYLEVELLPPLMAELARAAPKVQVWCRPFSDDFTPLLIDDQLDLGLGPPRPEHDRPGIKTKLLFEDRFVCLVRRGHPALKKRWSVESYAALGHAFIAPRGRPGGHVDTALAKLGLERNITLATPHFLVAPFVIAKSDLVLTIPSRMAAVLAGALALEIVKPPLELPTLRMSMFWHERVDRDPAHEWFREAVIASIEPKLRAKKPTRA